MPEKTIECLRILAATHICMLLGCGGGPSTDGHQGSEPTRQTSAAFSYYGVWGHGTVGVQDPANDFVIPESGNQTCFLTGVSGVLTTDPAGNSVAEVVQLSDGWHMVTTAPPGDILEITAVCLPTSLNQTERTSWGPGYQPTTLAPITANRVCGLVGVWAEDSSSWTSSDCQDVGCGDRIDIWQSGGNWVLGGAGDAAGWAMCVDVDATVGAWDAYSYPSNTWSLLSAPNGGAFGTQCFLTGLGGRFRNNNDWNNGVFVNYGSGWWGSFDGQWSLHLDGPKDAVVYCVQ
jgi:hypothetical protein